jgi:hypothetical protein
MRLSKKGFKEIYEIAGPFASNKKNKWATLILERMGKQGGYKIGATKTEDKVLELFNKKKTWLSVTDICLEL